MVDANNPRVFGKYEVIRRLAVGGMGEIFLARQVGVAGFDRLVILKSLLPQLADDSDMLSQFLDEARIVGSINHPSVVACLEVGEWEGVYFIAMEYVNGVDLANLIKAADDAGQRFPIHVALAVAREAALGLDSAHHALDPQGRPLKIVHRDISPHNIMVRSDGLAKVVDFGVAMATNKQKRTEGGLLKGKLGYMAPEQIKGQPVEARSDQFSLGVVLWELLAGRRLFVGESPEAVFMKIVRERIPPPSSVMSDVPVDADAIVLKMTAPEPSGRFTRLAEAAAAIRRLLDQRGAMEHETGDLVRELAGAQLAERVRDLSPSPVRILGIAAAPADSASASAALCGNCGAQTVKGDRFCRSCGAPMTQARKQGTLSPVPPLEQPVASIFAEVDDDLIDVALDDATGPRETGVASAIVELVDSGGSHVPPESMLKPLWSALQDVAGRYGGSLVTTSNRLSATFIGNGRGTRCAMAFARRAAVVVQRAHRELRLRAGVAGDPGVAHGDTAARDDAERIVGRARPGQLLVSERARRLANVLHAFSPGPEVPPQLPALPDATRTWEVPLPPALVGRGGERLVIEQALAASDVGRGQQLLFLGGAGAGKTTMLGAVDVEARDRGFVVATARCGRLRAPLRFDALRQVMRNACLELLASIPNSEGAAWHKALDALPLGAHERRKLRALGDGEVLHEDVPAARRRVLLRAALQGFFTAIAERRGLCVLLDDVDRGDTSSLELFAELGARLGTARFVLAAAGRPMQGERVLPLARRVMLEPLEEKDVTGVIAHVIGTPPPAALAQKVAASAGGNPWLVIAQTRFLLASNLVSFRGTEMTASVDLAAYPLPPTAAVLGVASHALLSPATQQVLSACAVLGQVVEPTELEALCPGVDVMAALAEAFAHGVLHEERGAAVFSASSDLDALGARLDPTRARELHARLADALAALPASEHSIEREERLLFHRLAADDAQRAAVHAEKAADAWANAGLFDATRDHYRRALHARWRGLAKDGRDEERARLALELAARASTAIGDLEPNAAVDLAMPILRAVPADLAVAARVEALRARGALLLKLRRTDEALALFDETLDACAGQIDAATWGSLLVDLALAMEQSGNPDGARAQLVEAHKKLEEAPLDKRVRLFDALLATGRLALRARDFARAREALSMAVEDARRRKSVSALIDALSALSSVEQGEGKVERSLGLLDDALSAAASVGDGVAEARLKQQAARCLQQLGRIPDALHVAKQALVVAQRLGWDEGAAVAGQLVQTLESRS